MTRSPMLPLAVIAATLVLSACASGPTTSTPGAATDPARGYGEMAPIPNPDGSRPAPAPRPAAPRPSPQAPAAKPAAPRPAPPAAAPKPPANAARAAQLRAQGLEQLNRGAIDRAVALLSQASQLDPGNALIQRDLARAVRIRGAVRAKP
ncbi:MAG: hypothetical protein V4656_02180 [Pseudomonadota bacterium]